MLENSDADGLPITFIKRELTEDDDVTSSTYQPIDDVPDLCRVDTATTTASAQIVNSFETSASKRERTQFAKDSLTPFFENGTWYLYAAASSGGIVKLPGLLLPAPRRKGRQLLAFKQPSGGMRKYILCQHCEANDLLVWVLHRNYVAQHIRRHHPEICTTCSSCLQLIDRAQMEGHVKFCAMRNKKSIKKLSGRPRFVAIAGPTPARTAEVEADELQTCLAAAGRMVALGSSDSVAGRPISAGPVMGTAPAEEARLAADRIMGIPVRENESAAEREAGLWIGNLHGDLMPAMDSNAVDLLSVSAFAGEELGGAYAAAAAAAALGDGEAAHNLLDDIG